MGAIVGALFAQTQNSFAVEKKIKEFLRSPVFERSRTNHKAFGSFLEQVAVDLCEQLKNARHMRETIAHMDAEMHKAMISLFGTADIRDCAIPFAAVATDLRDGAEIRLTKGSLAQAVLASSAMPGILSPVSIDGYLLSDGAATSAVPVRAARSVWPKTNVVAVDVSSQLSAHPPLDNSLSIIVRNCAITGFFYHKELIKEADVLIQPHVKIFGWNEFDNIDDFISEGEQATLLKSRLIKKVARRLG